MAAEIPRVGAGTVYRGGRRYSGLLVINDDTVTVDGWRRERWHFADGPGETRYRTHRTWPVGRVDHIDWIDSFEQAMRRAA